MMFKARFKVAESPDVFCAELSSLMALFGLGAMSDLSPLSGVKRKLDFGAVRAAFDPKRTLGRDKLCTNSGHVGKVIVFQRVAQRHRVLVGCAAASMRYHDEIRVFSRLM